MSDAGAAVEQITFRRVFREDEVIITNAPDTAEISLQLLMDADPKAIDVKPSSDGAILLLGSARDVKYRIVEWLSDTATFRIERITQ